jgi:hypothetical protein
MVAMRKIPVSVSTSSRPDGTEPSLVQQIKEENQKPVARSWQPVESKNPSRFNVEGFFYFISHWIVQPVRPEEPEQAPDF